MLNYIWPLYYSIMQALIYPSKYSLKQISMLQIEIYLTLAIKKKTTGKKTGKISRKSSIKSHLVG